MNNKIVIANLKMNMTVSETNNYLKRINGHINNQNVIICPTNIYIPYFLKKDYAVGIQNIYYGQSGPYTGETSPKQASSIGVKYAIIGHSERRNIFKETNKIINQKVASALKFSLKVILCLGETKEEHRLKKTHQIIKKQLEDALKGISSNDLVNVMIAYEPIWAIGTNVIPSNDDISTTVTYIREIVQKLFNISDIKVIYGGSINLKNIETLNKISNLSGYLIGGASIDPNTLLSIIEVAV